MTSKTKATAGGQNDCLSWGDSFFLYLEREGQPLSIASISEFEGQISAKDCARFIESKLHLIPRYRQHVVFPPFNVGLPVWEYASDFEVGKHIREVKLKQGTDAELKAVCGEILSTSLDRSRPLWDFTIVRGLTGNRTCILARVHHCLADGVAGVRLMNVLMDTTPTAVPRAPGKRPEAPPSRDPGALLIDGLARSYFSTVERLLKAHSEIVQGAHQAISGVSGSRHEDGHSSEPAAPPIAEMLAELATPAERLPFNRVCQGPHNIAWTGISLAEIKAVKNACATTVNDVVLAVLTAAIGRYSEGHGARLNGRKLRIVVPVNIRPEGAADDLGNRITFLPVNMPLDIRDPKSLLAAIHQRMDIHKAAGMAEIVSLAGTLAGAIPPILQALAAPLASKLPLSICNTIITNVPGPQVPLYLMGHKMVRWYPVVPIGGEMGMNVAVLSYNGVVYFGFHGDVNAAPDIERMEELVDSSFAELLNSIAPERTTRKHKPVKAQRRPAKKPPTKRASGNSKPAPRKRSAPRKTKAGAKPAAAPEPETVPVMEGQPHTAAGAA